MTSSTDSYYGAKSTAAYAASKAGINSLTKSLALNYAESKIRVNTVAPGWVETKMMETGGDALVEYAKSINPFKRNCNPKEIAELIDFLVSDKCPYLNGQVITLDGGYTLQDPTIVFEEQQLTKLLTK
jgi:3-oxoacyl-[acyl-carrier protein] reductase